MEAFAVARQTIRAFSKDNCTTLAAAIAYYTLFSIFPLILGIVAILGVIFIQPSTRDQFVAAIVSAFPGSEQLILETVNQVVQGRGAAGIIATLGLIWSASGVFGALTQALDTIWHVSHPRGPVQSAALSIVLVLSVGVIFVISLLLSTVLAVAANTPLPLIGVPLGSVPLLFALLEFVFPYFIAFAIFVMIYWVMPHVRLRWPSVWPGALLASVLFEISKQIFVWYISTFAQYNAVYGSIGAVIILLSWAFYLGIVVLLGAEFNGVLTQRSGGDLTGGD